MRSITSKEVHLKNTERNNYRQLTQKVKETLKGTDVNKIWTIKATESEIDKLIGSKREHLSAKYGLAQIIEKNLTKDLGKRTYCKFTQEGKAFYISNEKL